MSLGLLALALLMAPMPSASRRLRALTGIASRRWRVPRLGRTGVLLISCAVVGLCGGPGGVVAAALVGFVLWRGFRTRAARRGQLVAASAIADGLGALVTELRAGAHPAAAAAGAAQDAEEPASAVLAGISSTARLGGDVDQALTGLALARPELRTPLAQLARAWQLADRHGVPLADVLEAVRRDLDRRVTFARQIRARMAGPEASAAVLAALPVFGVLLGQLSGADPLRVLTSTPVGQVLLVIGALLVCAGLLWSGRLTGQAVLP
jgi:tight adherence protein B